MAPPTVNRLARANPPKSAEPAAEPLPKLVDLRNMVRTSLGQALRKEVHEPAGLPGPEKPVPAPEKRWKWGAIALGFLTLAGMLLLAAWLHRRRRRRADARRPAEDEEEDEPPRRATARR